MAKNFSLLKARETKNDEFYTLYEDIEKELANYKQYFQNKTIYCPCDDPYKSNFVKYFINNFENLKLKRLICTCYNPIADIFDLINEDSESGKVLDITNSKDIFIQKLINNGDFRSKECIEYLKQSDIVVTNPPFSLFREFIELLFKFDKKFLVIGNQTILWCKSIFPLFLKNKFWFGYNYVKKFFTPDNTIQNFGNICWFTNLTVTKENKFLKLTSTYSPENYQKYVNYDAIDVEEISKIPKDYTGKMGVPINFLAIYNPKQFEIIGCDRCLDDIDYIPKKFLNDYFATGSKSHITTGMKILCYYDKNNVPKFPSMRIIVRLIDF